MISPGPTTAESLRSTALAAGALELPGRGGTALRLAGLRDLGAGDLATARIAEGHADAVAILADAGRVPEPDCLYGVWASVAGHGDVTATAVAGGWVLDGTKPFCSGAALCDRALVRAGDLLVDVDLRQPGVAAVEGTWDAVGMAGSDSRSVRFEAVVAGPRDVVGTTDWYLSRPGFAHGGIGVAAVWAGGAGGVLDATAGWVGTSAREADLADLGDAAVAMAVAGALLDAAAAAIDDDPIDVAGGARRLATVTRHGVHAAAVEVMRRCAGAGGARPICLDADNSRRHADLWAYLAQHHPGRDAATIGRQLVEATASADPARRPTAGPAGPGAGGQGAARPR